MSDGSLPQILLNNLTLLLLFLLTVKSNSSVIDIIYFSGVIFVNV